MTEAEKWAAFDIAKNRLSVLIGHYAELIFTEQRKDSPDLERIEQWQREEDAAIDQEAALDVENQVHIEQINTKLEPVVRQILRKG